MPTVTSEAAAIDAARQYVYRVLSLLTSDPKSQRWQHLYDPALRTAAVAAGQFLREEREYTSFELAPGEIAPDQLDLEKLLAFLKPHTGMLAEYQQIFGLTISKKCPPYETEYCPQTFSVYRSQQLADIAGFYRAFGLEPSRDLPERHDHLALELEFMAWLIAKELRAGDDPDKIASCREAQKRFFADHLAWWVPAFALALRRRADRIPGVDRITSPPQSIYGAIAQALASFISMERALLGIAPPTDLMMPQETADSDPACDECCAAASINPK
jgi:TorA maturation chaperone TorD